MVHRSNPVGFTSFFILADFYNFDNFSFAVLAFRKFNIETYIGFIKDKSMLPPADKTKGGFFDILAREEADQLVTEALDTDSCEPEAFVRLLIILLDHAQEPCLK